MATIFPNLLPVYNEFLDYLLDRASPEEILAFRVSDEAQARAAELMDRNNAGTLTTAERGELEHILEFERSIALLKAEALKALRQS